MTDHLKWIYPVPKQMTLTGGSCSLKSALVYRPLQTVDAEMLRPALDYMRTKLGNLLRPCPEVSDLPALRFQPPLTPLKPQGYRLAIDGKGTLLEANDKEGFFYGATTLVQIIAHRDGTLPCCEIVDAPDYAIRGVMLDVSRDKVPTLETLYWLIDHLAELRFNHLQLYVEHAFAYSSHEEVWKEASPLTAEEIEALDRFCAERCIDLVPNQNSFGHLERWLEHPRYLPLAELPQGGAPLPWGGFQEKPSSLCPIDPKSLLFLEELYDEYLPHFSSKLFNVGCDEPFDLRGSGRSQEQVKRLGEGRVYLDFVLKLHQLVTRRGRRMAFWGDIIINHPELVPEIPKDALVLEWGYEADHPFDAHGARFAASNIPFCVCPGTSSWNSLGGRSDTMLKNIRSAAENGRRHGACGLIVCDWGDWGHWQPLGLSLPAFTYAAGAGWNVASAGTLDLCSACDRLWTEGYAQTLLDLGEVHSLSGVTRGNSTELFHILSKPMSRPILASVTLETLQAVLGRLEALEAGSPQGSGILATEVRHTFAMLRAACHRGKAILSGRMFEPEIRRALALELKTLTGSMAHVWRLRNREGGLRKSIARLDPILREYETG